VNYIIKLLPIICGYKSYNLTFLSQLALVCQKMLLSTFGLAMLQEVSRLRENQEENRTS
jgi:hypothetical protein